ncbi:VapC toxin family PIN domain ribonuclease [Bosea sp. Tri-44]|uniref:PIN domain-containing protein n=1 Tax=Bosea sp. Tri-44 TaxID=1972137 RepID=UPI00100F5692|nr:PIN domain-containing protein [Bosea sp. Tri-44]RXT52527.1 VapC toxin family PIN domain ribonuclease [Bosea sp. Tri-44]
MTRSFLDSNVVVYAFCEDPRNALAEELLGRGCEISVQVLNEFANVARRKLGFSWAEITDAVEAITILSRTVHPLDLATHQEAVRLAERYGFSLYDALIVASALRAGCAVLYSEDMQHGLVIDERLRIENPFKAE